MKKLFAALLILVLCLFCALACAESVTAIDMKGRAFTLPAPATRVLAVSAADCEILYALGAGDTLVGRGEYCDYPAEVLSLPVVSSGAELNLEQIIALSPQVVLISTMAQTIEHVESLERAGITVVVSESTDIRGVYESIALIGAVTGKTSEADALIARMQEDFAAIREKTADTDKTVYFEISPLEWGLWTAGANTFMDEIGEICGLKNVFSDVDGWAAISQEQVIERSPDYIVTTMVAYEGSPTPEEEIIARAGWDKIHAVANNRVFRADNDAFTRPGPRLVDAAQSLCDFITAE